jgi:hypothetical protein
MCAARKIVNRRGSSAKERDVRKYCCCVHVWRVGSLCICGKCAMVKVRTSLDTYSIYKGLCPKDLRIRAFSERTSFWRHLEVIYLYAVHDVLLAFRGMFTKRKINSSTLCLVSPSLISRGQGSTSSKSTWAMQPRHGSMTFRPSFRNISGCFRHVHRVRSWES